MQPDEEAQSFTSEPSQKSPQGSGMGVIMSVSISCLVSIVTCIIIGCIVYNITNFALSGQCLNHIQNKSKISSSAKEPFEAPPLPQTQRLQQEEDSPGTLHGRFTIQQQQLLDKKNNSSVLLDQLKANFMVNWTASRHQNDSHTSNIRFKTDSNGCVIIPRTGLWLAHSEVTFAYSNESEDQIWVYMEVNNATVLAKKTITLPRKEYRSINAHLPIDITDFIDFKEKDTLCVLVSNWRTVYASEIDNSLTLVYQGHSR